MSELRKRVLKDSLYTSFSTVYNQGLQSLRGFLLGKFLGPELLGLWSNLLLILQYVTNLHLGTLVVLTREYPYFKEKGDEEKKEHLKNVAFTYNISIGIVFLICITGYYFLFGHRHEPIFRYGLLIIGILLLFQRFYDVYSRMLRAENDFLSLAKNGIFFATINALSAIVLTYFYGLGGLYAAVLITYICTNLFLYFLKPIKYKFILDFKIIWYLIKEGIPLFLLNFMYMIVRSIDKLMILIFLTRVDLGYYHFSIMFLGFFMMVPMTIASVMFPKFAQKRADYEDDYPKYKNMVIIPMDVMSYFAGVMIVTGMILIPPFIRFFLQEYLPMLEFINILLVGTYFLSFVFIANDYLISMKMHWKIVAVYIYTILINIILNYLFVKMGFGLIGISTATTITFIVFSFSIQIITFKMILVQWKRILLQVLTFAVIFAVLLLIHFLVNLNVIQDYIPLLINWYVQLPVFLILQIPLFLYLNKRYDLINFVKTTILKR